jgi:hypothetical protein
MADNSNIFLLLENGDCLLQETGDPIIASDASRITSLTDDWKSAQESKIRIVSGALYIISHLSQYGRQANASKELGGSAGKKLGQSFIPPKSFACSAVEVFIKGNPANTSLIKGSVCQDNSGVPGTVITSFSMSPVVSYEYAWERVQFNSDANLSAGTKYWIVFENYSANMIDNSYVGIDAVSAGEYASASYISSWVVDSSNVLMTRLVSSSDDDNEQKIDDAISWKITRDIEKPAYSLQATVVNSDYKYSYGHSHSSYMDAGKTIKAYIGLTVNGLMVNYLAFIGETEKNPASQATVTLNAKCLMKRLIEDQLTSESLDGIAYETMIQRVAEHAGITSFNLRTTGKISRSGISFRDLSASSIAEQVAQATVDRLQFYNTKTLHMTARKKASTAWNSDVKYEIREDNFIKDNEISLEVNTDNMINRLTVTNDENGETTTDGVALIVGDYQTIGSASGTIPAGTDTTRIQISFSLYQSIYIQFSDSENNVVIKEVSRDCGTYNTYGSIVLDITNKNYPSASASYNITVKGCPVSNSGSGTICIEKADQTSIDQFGLFSDRVDNKIFANITDAEEFANAVMNERSRPLEIIKARCRGIADIYPDDVVAFNDNRMNLHHVAIARLIEISYSIYPANYEVYIEALKIPGRRYSFVSIESGSGDLLLETGEKIKL